MMQEYPHAAVLAGHSVLFRTAADLLADLDGDWMAALCPFMFDVKVRSA